MTITKATIGRTREGTWAELTEAQPPGTLFSAVHSEFREVPGHPPGKAAARLPADRSPTSTNKVPAPHMEGWRADGASPNRGDPERQNRPLPPA